MRERMSVKEFQQLYARRVFGREQKDGECVTCGKSVDKSQFRDELSLREYKISFMCQKCQDGVFGE